MKYIWTFLIALIPALGLAQDDLLSQWPSDVRYKANTAANSEDVSEYERDVIFYCNLARMDGQKFAETFLVAAVDSGWADAKSPNYKSLQKDLKKGGCKPLLYQKELYTEAKSWATLSGQRGWIGHKDFDQRYRKILRKYVEAAENCYYGPGSALRTVIVLLMDEGVDDLGHRKNILNPKFHHLGVSRQPHSKEQLNTVMSFGGMFK